MTIGFIIVVIYCVGPKVHSGLFVSITSYGKPQRGTSLVVQWLRLGAPMQGAQIGSLGRELYPTCSN